MHARLSGPWTRGFLTSFLALLAAACTPLAAFNTLAPKDRLAAAPERGVAYGAAPRQRLDIYRPAPGDGPAPVMVFFYGGGWDSGRREDYAFVGRALAAQGFVTIVPDYRLVPEVRFPTFVEDAAAAVAWAQDQAARYGGDRERLFLMGHSAGAYNAMMVALDTRFLAAAGGDPAGVRGVIGLAGPYDFLPFDVAASINAFAAFPEPAATQPVTFARSDAPPLLLLHGDKDETVRPRNSHALARRQRSAGGEVDVRVYEGLNHADILLALSRPLRGKAPVLADVRAFAHD